ncbi:MAG: isopentenyl-diphosphate Delta-isomerase [Chitinophagaceae bacterium]
MIREEVILVNEFDEQVGVMEKLEAHQQPILHRAFSVFIFNSKGEMLLQKRAATKYHSANLWTNACCSHPRPYETVQIAAERRLKEEMGFSTLVKPAFTFTYQAAFDNGLYEYEFDHVFIGKYDGDLSLNNEEVQDYTYQSLQAIEELIQSKPEIFTAWFKIAFPKLITHLQNNPL